MKSVRLVHWLQIGANLAILAGLILVALQINQNSDLARHQLLHDQFALMVSKENTIMGENPAVVWSKAVHDPTNLSLAELRVMEAYYYRTYMKYVFLYENRDFYEDEWKRSIRREGGWFLQSEFGHAWWDQNKQGLEYSELRDAIDAEVKTTDSGQIDYFQNIINRLDKSEQ